MPPTTPPPPSPAPKPTPPRQSSRSWSRMVARANTLSGVITLLITVAALGGFIGFGIALLRHTATPKTTTPTVQNLSPEDISKLSQIGDSLGTSGQVLNIGASSLFRSNVSVGGSLSIAGQLNANGPVVLSQLNITGTTALTGLNVGSNLTVGGTTTLQKSLTVNDLLAVNGGLNVSGTASVNALNAGTIAVHNLSISGPLAIAHVQTQGPTPTANAGGAIGAGGTVSISGNDTAGTINLNTGGGPTTGNLMNIVFRAAYGSTVHVQLTPLSGAAAATPVYVTRSANGFTVRTDSPAPAGAVLSYDYLVVQ